ncbi:TetR/AcrR family transcriptional regulator [Hyphomonas sp. FCG-A18]|uniref:TetR/AcrR family transcriptional regulator n=1 Tax=Hyphomonas sp. FCG-A18 TaxID=3080019 RepID=UPI002B30B497|nr:TetR/AcrR family transcriptional regulator [Hyphomonas sp. FCG-A18]
MQHTKSERAARTRDALLSAGFDLMLDRSVDAIPIDDLVAAAGVGKGSFFNHFGDKERFKSALAIEVRGEIETKITTANLRVTEPLERLAGGMREVSDYALKNRKRTISMLRMMVASTGKEYPLNEGVRSDIAMCVDAKLIRANSEQAAILYWLGLCVALITHIVEVDLSREKAAGMLSEFVNSGLVGLGADAAVSSKIGKQCSDALKAMR